MNKRLLLTILLTICTLLLVAQTDNTKPRATKDKSKYDKMFGEVQYGDKIYKQGSNWLTFGMGVSYKINYEPSYGERGLNRTMALAYHFRYKAVYFNVGWHFSGENFFFESWYNPALKGLRAMHQLNDFHAGAGLRFEDRWYNFAFFIGPSWAIAWVQHPDIKTGAIIKNTIGGHVEVQTTFKFLYDMGIGVSLFGSFNKHYQVVGVQGHFYFSGAYKMRY